MFYRSGTSSLKVNGDVNPREDVAYTDESHATLRHW